MSSRAAARTAVFDYIETFCNRVRLHSTLDYLSPVDYEKKEQRTAKSCLTTRRPRKRGRSNDYSQLTYAEVLTTLTARDAAGFLRRAIAWYAASGISVKAVMSDNGSAYISDHYARTLRQLGLRHLRIKPRRPRTNGKAERLIQTLLKEWAYARIYGSSNERNHSLTVLPQPIQLPTTRQPQPQTTGLETEQRRW